MAQHSHPLDGEVCAFCGTAENLSRHHISYKPTVIKILCWNCHERLHVPEFRKLHPKKVAKSCSGKISLDRFYLSKEVAEILNISQNELFTLIKNEEFPPWDQPYGPKIKGYWGRTLTGATHSLKSKRKKDKAIKKQHEKQNSEAATGPPELKAGPPGESETVLEEVHGVSESSPLR